jgi:hypothetical protein
MLADGDKSLVEQDIKGDYHFNGNFKNAGDLSDAIVKLENTKYGLFIQNEKKALLDTFELGF